MTLGESLSLSGPLFPHLLDGASNSHPKAIPRQGMRLAQSPAEWASRTISLMLFHPLVRTSPSKSPPPHPHSTGHQHLLQETLPPAPCSWLPPPGKNPEFHLLGSPSVYWLSVCGHSDQGSMAAFSDGAPRTLPKIGRLRGRGCVPWKVTLRGRQSAPGKQSQQARNPRT